MMYFSLKEDMPIVIPMQVWENETFDHASIQVQLARLDLIHPDFGGNKYFKLKYNLIEARRQGKSTLRTFGGAYSNHIWATAALGYHQNMQTIGIIRGEETLPLNPVLAQASAWGMSLQYVNRTDYRALKTGVSPCLPCEYVIPEGGSNLFAVQGCTEILPSIALPAYQYVAVPCGTGATLAGLVSTPGNIKARILGVSVLKGGDFFTAEVHKLLGAGGRQVHQSFEILTAYHFGGYAKSTPALKVFSEHFATEYFALDEVYTAKMLYAICNLAQQGYFPTGSTVVALVTQRSL